MAARHGVTKRKADRGIDPPPIPLDHYDLALARL